MEEEFQLWLIDYFKDSINEIEELSVWDLEQLYDSFLIDREATKDC